MRRKPITPVLIARLGRGSVEQLRTYQPEELLCA